MLSVLRAGHLPIGVDGAGRVLVHLNVGCDRRTCQKAVQAFGVRSQSLVGGDFNGGYHRDSRRDAVLSRVSGPARR